MLIDTNLIIDSVHPDYPQLRRWLVRQIRVKDAEQWVEERV